jgi:hypothetical protein
MGYLKNILISLLAAVLFVIAWAAAVWFIQIRPHLGDGEGAVVSISGALPRWVFLLSVALVFCGVYSYLNRVRNRRQREISGD